MKLTLDGVMKGWRVAGVSGNTAECKVALNVDVKLSDLEALAKVSKAAFTVTFDNGQDELPLWKASDGEQLAFEDKKLPEPIPETMEIQDAATGEVVATVTTTETLQEPEPTTEGENDLTAVTRSALVAAGIPVIVISLETVPEAEAVPSEA